MTLHDLDLIFLPQFASSQRVQLILKRRYVILKLNAMAMDLSDLGSGDTSKLERKKDMGRISELSKIHI